MPTLDIYFKKYILIFLNNQFLGIFTFVIYLVNLHFYFNLFL